MRTNYSLLFGLLVAICVMITGAHSQSPLPFPDEFTALVNVTFLDGGRSILYKMHYDASNTRFRLDSWGVDSDAPTIFADPDPLYSYIFLYNRGEQLSLVPGPRGYRCLISNLNDSFPEPAPAFHETQYLGHRSFGNETCDVWNGTNSDWGDVSYAQIVQSEIPRWYGFANMTYDYTEFERGAPPEGQFRSPYPCKHVGNDQIEVEPAEVETRNVLLFWLKKRF
eukprot:TRINITY_DN13770_c0_g1_i1.p1 TRINITY_DN13770_c0_g1~~TRINITY_DN13770_c0_g1_i1.p1  ORF type:complete len:224 (-),score=24.36 TRINITY_DN13770_c0_g1_i1:282-953(-)